MRAKAQRCPLCSVALIDAPFQPASKELDHIIPINIGGTHTIGNVRIICRLCNIRRPKDGSDYVGAVTLWAQDLEIAAALVVSDHPATPADDGTSRPKQVPCLGCTRRTERAGGWCRTCRPLVGPRAEDGRRAAAMRAEGHSWRTITDTIGFSWLSNCIAAARKYGPPEVVATWLKWECADCGAALPVPVKAGRPHKRCVSCRDSRFRSSEKGQIHAA